MIKLIYPNPFFEDYSSNNVNVENCKDYLKITPFNKHEIKPYWISLAIDKGFEYVKLPNEYFIILKGIFNNSVIVSIDKDIPIQLNEKCTEYKIPLPIDTEIKAINIQGEIDQSIYIERLSIEYDGYEIPSEKRKFYFITKPHYDDRSLLRKGEKDILDLINITTDINEIDDNTIVYVRPIDELVTEEYFKKITDQLNEIKSKSKAKIINDIENFYNYKIKNNTFKIWKKNNILCPEYQIIKEENDIYPFLEKYERCILRINEDWGGRNTYVINKTSNIKGLFKQLYDHKLKQIMLGYKDIEIIVTRKINPIKYEKDLILNLGRCFVVNDNILNIHSFVHRMNNDDQLTGSIASDEDFVEAHKRVLVIGDNYKDIFINGVKCLGLQTGCVDFLIENDKPILLEVNAFWGMGMGTINYPYSKNLEKYLLDNYDTYKVTAKNIYERMDQYNLWKKFYEML